MSVPQLVSVLDSLLASALVQALAPEQVPVLLQVPWPAPECF
ncbi:hypothetical protein QP228_001040 [Pseudoglutamicibacter cumminsii]|nr:hypothetical protein [Pseudoglutamicibacter cumminsii]MDZ3744613.1 hypothetical protein [Pseudoglutamicibacter cumminsii]